MITNQQNQKEQDSQLLKQAHDNYLGLHETVALVANLREQLGQKIDYVLNESTESRITDSQLRMLVVEIKAIRNTINYVHNSKSITRTK